MRLTTHFKPLNHFTVQERFWLIFPHYLSSLIALFSPSCPTTLRGTLCSSFKLHSVLWTEGVLFLYISISLDTVSPWLPMSFSLWGLLHACSTFHSNGTFFTEAIQMLDAASYVLTVLAFCYHSRRAPTPSSTGFGTRLLLTYLIQSPGICTWQAFDTWGRRDKGSRKRKGRETGKEMYGQYLPRPLQLLWGLTLTVNSIGWKVPRRCTPLGMS